MNRPSEKIGIVAVSRDCFPESLSVNRRANLMKALRTRHPKLDVYECPICIVESELHMVQALDDIKGSFAEFNKQMRQTSFNREQSEGKLIDLVEATISQFEANGNIIINNE